MASLTFPETARPGRERPATSTRSPASPASSPIARLRPLYLVNFILYLALFGFFRVYPMYLVDEFGLGVSAGREYVAYVSVPIVIANVWLVGALMQRYSPRTMVIGSALVGGASWR